MGLGLVVLDLVTLDHSPLYTFTSQKIEYNFGADLPYPEVTFVFFWLEGLGFDASLRTGLRRLCGLIFF